MPLFWLSKSDIEKMEAKRDVDGLVKALSYKKDASVAFSAAKALVTMRDEHAVDGLIVSLKDPDLNVGKLAGGVLVNIGGRQTVDKLIVALKSPDANVRFYAALTLGEIGDARAFDALSAVSKNDKDAPAAAAAGKACVQILQKNSPSQP